MTFTFVDEEPMEITDLRGTPQGLAVAAWLRDTAENGDNGHPYDRMIAMADYLEGNESE